MNTHLNSIALKGCALAVALWAHACQAVAEPDLTAASLEELLALKVVGASKYEQAQHEVAAAVSVLTREDIRSFGWRTLAEALASLPGIHTTYDRQYAYLGARGFGLPGDSNTRVLITINGNRVNNATYDSGPVGGQFPLDLDLVERIEFIPGPGGAVYGHNAMFGVVNVVTRTGRALDATELALQAQPLQGLRRTRLSYGRRDDDGLDLLMSTTALDARGQDHFFDFGASGVSGLARGMDGERDRELFLRLARSTWSLDVLSGNDRKDDPTASYFAEPLVPGQSQRERFSLAQFQLQGGQPEDVLRFHLRLFAGEHHYQGQFNYGAPQAYPVTSDWRGGEWRLLYGGLQAHKLMLGLEVQDNVRVQQNIPDPADPSRTLAFNSPGWRHGVYLQDEWSLRDTLRATLGLRLDHNHVTGLHTSPRLGLIWQAAAATTIKTLYGRAHRAPSAYERDLSDGVSQVSNPALRGETIDTLELVADQRVGADLLLRGTAYQWRMADLIVLGRDAASALPQYQNGERIKARGVELSADQVWPSGARLRGSVSLQHVRDGEGARLLNSPAALGKLNGSAPLPLAGLRLGLELQLNSRRRTLDGSDCGAYTLVNAHLYTERLAPGLSVGLGVRNLLDRRYADPGAGFNWQNALAQDGRSLRAEASLKF